MSITPPAAVLRLLSALEQQGHAAYIVGGCVRDSLMGRSPADWDIATSALPQEVQGCFPHCYVVGTGLRHGTVTVVADHIPYEVTTFRIDGVYSDNRRPDSVTFTRELQADLSRRDFTINAMAWNPESGLVDPFGGVADLGLGRITCVDEPAVRFGEDALRILRAVRFAAVLEFAIDGATSTAMEASIPLLDHIAPERIRAELDKALVGPGVERAFLEHSAVIARILPELAPCMGFRQHNPHHDRDVWAHTLHAVGAAVPDPMVRLALLFHDVAKPQCFTLDDQGIGHFYGHGKAGAELTGKILARLRYDNHTRSTVEQLVLLHDTPIPSTAKAVKRWLNRLGEADFRRLQAVKRGDSLAHAAADIPPALAALDELGLLLEQILGENQCFRLRDLAVNGNDLLTLGIPQGQQVGAVLQLLLEQVLDDALPNQRDALLEHVRRSYRLSR